MKTTRSNAMDAQQWRGRDAVTSQMTPRGLRASAINLSQRLHCKWLRSLSAPTELLWRGWRPHGANEDAVALLRRWRRLYCVYFGDLHYLRMQRYRHEDAAPVWQGFNMFSIQINTFLYNHSFYYENVIKMGSLQMLLMERRFQRLFTAILKLIMMKEIQCNVYID